jgi:hypothetical protein
MGLEIVFFSSETQKWILTILAGSNFVIWPEGI